MADHTTSAQQSDGLKPSTSLRVVGASASGAPAAALAIAFALLLLLAGLATSHLIDQQYQGATEARLAEVARRHAATLARNLLSREYAVRWRAMQERSAQSPVAALPPPAPPGLSLVHFNRHNSVFTPSLSSATASEIRQRLEPHDGWLGVVPNGDSKLLAYAAHTGDNDWLIGLVDLAAIGPWAGQHPVRVSAGPHEHALQSVWTADWRPEHPRYTQTGPLDALGSVNPTDATADENLYLSIEVASDQRPLMVRPGAQLGLTLASSMFGGLACFVLITRKRAREKSQESLLLQQLATVLFDNAIPGCAVCTPAGRLLIHNQRFIELMQDTDSLASGSGLNRGTYLVEDAVLLRLQQTLKDGEARTMDIRPVPDRQCRLSISRLDLDRPLLILQLDDISEIALQERLVTQKKQSIDQLLLTAGVGLFRLYLLDNNPVIELAEATAQLLGLGEGSRIRLTRETALAMIHEEDQPLAESLLDQIHQPGQPVWEERLRLKTPGGQLWVRIHVRFERSADGIFSQALGIVVDQTLLNSALAKVEALAATKDHFLQTVNREMRGALTSVENYLEVLQGVDLSSDVRSSVQAMRHASRSLDSIVDNILDFIDLERAELRLNPVSFNPAQMLAELSAEMRLLIERSGVKLVLSAVPRPLENLFLADAQRIRQCLRELILNAIKFTREGSITIEATATDDTDETCTLKIAVSDTGEGINADARRRLLDRFTQADESDTRRVGGVGIGLALVSKLLRLLGGELEIQSEPGRGSTFSIKLTLLRAPDAASAADMPSEQPGSLSGLRILLVDDSDIYLEAAAVMLGAAGAEIHAVESGTDAIRYLSAPGNTPHVILLDLEMPGLSGLETLSILKQFSELRDVPIIGVSAYVLEADRREALQAGMNAFIAKPYKQHQLISCILQEVAGQLPERQPPPAVAELDRDNDDGSWPMIEGIDIPAVRERLLDDRPLFEKQLQRLLSASEQFDNARPEAMDADALQQYAKDLHKLAGAAGLLEAGAVARSARALMTSIRQGRNDAFSIEQATLEADINALNTAASKALAALHHTPAAHVQSSNAEVDEVDQASLDRLKTALSEQRFDAIRDFEQLKLRIEARYGTRQTNALEAAIKTFDFDEAVRLLEPLRNQ